MPYLAWVYDSPIFDFRSQEITYPTNRIMLFDSYEMEELRSKGFNNIFWLPLASDPVTVQNHVQEYSLGRTDLENDIVFLGRFYGSSRNNEKFYKTIVSRGLLPPFWHGYLEGIMDCQHVVYGENFIGKCMNPDIVQALCNILGESPDKVYDTTEYRLTNLLINMELSARERVEYIQALAERFSITVHTPSDHPDLPGVLFKEVAPPTTLAPAVENHAKINLNISLRTIKNGVPLRVFDTMAAGGFMLSNYQSDIDSLFLIGEDLVTFDSKEDLIRKCEYYLKHDDERKQIAENGLNSVIKHHTYDHRVAEMMSFI
ncbi:MAG: glycosyltransferase [Lachnospiraceae bacterium]|nr:glycosyltransferase [Lachnospiraceae bacterium]